MKPILFKTEMVKAILAGNKTQTRRVVQPQPDADQKLIGPEMYTPALTDKDGELYPGPEVYGIYSDDGEFGVKCPYGKIGDILWVRETFCDFHGLIIYKADEKYNEIVDNDLWRWKPSIFMPHEAARIFLEVTDIRVERLQDISENDAKAEGIVEFTKDGVGFEYGIDGWNWSYEDGWPSMCTNRVYAYEELWDLINGKKYPWSSNPWVWVISFNRVDERNVTKL